MTQGGEGQPRGQQPPMQGGKLLAAAVSIGVNLFLIAIKVVVALATGSLGMLAEVGHSIADLAASGFAYWGIRLSTAPPDSTHHYGHQRYENLSSLIQMGLLVLICLYIFYEVYQRLAFGFSLAVSEAALVVVLASLAIDLFTARYLHRAAHTYSSPALEADAYHFTADLWSSSAVLLGLLAARFGYEIVDPVAAVVVALVMLYTAFRLGRRATGVLLDASPGPEVEAQVRAILRHCPPGVSFHRLRLRQAGSHILIDLSLHVPREMSVGEAHETAHRLSRQIRDRVPMVSEAVVHVEPAGHREEAGEEIEAEEGS